MAGERLIEVEIDDRLVKLSVDHCRDLAERLLRLVDASDDGWRRGSIVSFNPGRGFGFVKPDVGVDDVFFRREYTSLADDEIRPGARVEFLCVEIAGKTRISAMRLA